MTEPVEQKRTNSPMQDRKTAFQASDEEAERGEKKGQIRSFWMAFLVNGRRHLLKAIKEC